MPQEQRSAQSSDLTQQETDQQDVTRQEGDFAEQASSLDSLLDDIESTLETNAEEYVSSFVQKGGE
ncbi:ubiquitin-like protein Pup [Bifidobacterium primatium]|uniref:Prokaryotic ubiquitin-like protein Pup n=2 Tax=Bifidobacterium TaxID=1678 RepID=A0A2M9H7K4_9BIFI|nr:MULTISPECIES: ubiquitin-like protein Pup [Bifidobacterium]NEG95597.1 ubiquitin-like protein Pup [Bifidobacterium sp. SMB2]NEH11910.1 ubiquitin-like protein Pup [Bifidobacterium saimiriisciurei]PJM72776.1 ubiquitin-like protein Pup [Bifidobacterium primatium]